MPKSLSRPFTTYNIFTTSITTGSIMAPSSTTATRIEEARALAKKDASKAESIYKDILSQGPGSTETSSRDYENALIGLGELYRDEKKPQEIAELIKTSRDTFSSFAKAKTAKLGKSMAMLIVGLILLRVADPSS